MIVELDFIKPDWHDQKNAMCGAWISMQSAAWVIIPAGGMGSFVCEENQNGQPHLWRRLLRADVQE
jgi:hypothetical protein